MSTIRARVQLHNPAREPRVVEKDFVVARDVVADPIVLGEVLHLDDNIAARLVVASVQSGDPALIAAIISEPGMDTDLRVSMAEADGWTVTR